MQQPFLIDVYTTDSKNNLRKKRIPVDFLEMALKIMDTYSTFYDVTRIVVSRRIGGSRDVFSQSPMRSTRTCVRNTDGHSI